LVGADPIVDSNATDDPLFANTGVNTFLITDALTYAASSTIKRFNVIPLIV